MSEHALDEIDTSDVSDVTVIDQSGQGERSGSLIGAEKDGRELTIWIDSEMD